MSAISWLACAIQIIAYLKFHEKTNFMMLMIIVNAAIFALINVLQMLIYWFEKSETTLCTVFGVIFQADLFLTITITTLLSLYFCAKFFYDIKFSNYIELKQLLRGFHQYTVISAIIAVLAILVGVGMTIAPFISGNYGNAGEWCWIKQDKNNSTCKLFA